MSENTLDLQQCLQVLRTALETAPRRELGFGWAYAVLRSAHSRNMTARNDHDHVHYAWWCFARDMCPYEISVDSRNIDDRNRLLECTGYWFAEDASTLRFSEERDAVFFKMLLGDNR